MIEKKEQRIFDNPTPEQVKAVLEKAKKTSQNKKKGPAAASPDKMDILLEKVEGLVKRQDRLEEIYTKGAVTATGSPGSKKKVNDQEKEAAKTNEELLREAELEQERAQGKEEQPAQLTPEQYQKLNDTEKVKILEAQLQQQQGGQQPGLGKLTGQQGLYGLIEIIKATAPTIQTAIAKGGSNSESPLKIFLSQLSTYESIEKGVMDRFFGWMKMLSPGQREKTMDNIATSGPGNVEVRKTDDGRIKE